MLKAGIARTDLTPFWGVELTGWGYYIGRTWREIRDALFATALACEGDSGAAIVVALDMMVIDERFTSRTRSLIHDAIGVAAESVMLTCSHSHNAPAAGGLRGVGECDPLYEEWAAHQAATAAILAWRNRCAANVLIHHAHLNDLTFNRTRAGGSTDTNLTVAHVVGSNGDSIAVVVNYAAHPTVYTKLHPFAVSADVPGEVRAIIEQKIPGTTGIYIQGACGDVNFLKKFQSDDRCQQPASTIATAVVELIDQKPTASTSAVVAASAKRVDIPTRRWTLQEIHADRDEAHRRLAERDVSRWLETIGRSMTNRPEDMIDRHGGDEWKAVESMCRFNVEWTEEMMQDLETRDQLQQSEVQSLRMGDLFIVANASELFSPFALDVRRRSGIPGLMIACYANGRIGYLPDAHDIEKQTYAGIQSPKYCNQFPFTESSGRSLCDAMLEVLAT